MSDVAARVAVVFLVVGVGCAKRVSTVPATHPNEVHVLAETQRFAAALGVRVRGVITTHEYMVPAANPRYPGEKVQAAGWYKAGVAYYWRPVIRERDQVYGTALAAHEVCHARSQSDETADTCAAELLAPSR